jgi:hypothetical protein
MSNVERRQALKIAGAAAVAAVLAGRSRVKAADEAGHPVQFQGPAVPPVFAGQPQEGETHRGCVSYVFASADSTLQFGLTENGDTLLFSLKTGPHTESLVPLIMLAYAKGIPVSVREMHQVDPKKPRIVTTVMI